MERLTFDGNFCDIAQCRELPCRHGGNCTQKKVWERLKQFEDAADLAHGWNRPDEKMPEEREEVLCWYEYFRYGAFNGMYRTYGIGFQYKGNWGGEVANGRNAKVLAWMPLPDPPKGDEDE